MVGFRPQVMGVGLVLIMLLALAVPARALAQSTMSRGQTLGLLLLLGLTPRPPATGGPASKDADVVKDRKPRIVAAQTTGSPPPREARQFRLTYDELNGRLVVRSVESGDPQRAKPH